jgi:hypothetical protein
MKLPLAPLVLSALVAAPAARPAAGPAPPMPEAGVIRVTPAPEAAGRAWDVTLPGETAPHLIDQVWLVVDGKPRGLGGGDRLDTGRPLRVSAAFSDERDGEVKDILSAQGLPVRRNVTVYQITYGVDRPVAVRSPLTLRFRHATNVTTYTPLEFSAPYKVGDKITLLDAVMLDSSVRMSDVQTSSDLFSPRYKRLSDDLVHRVTLQIQFLPSDRIQAKAEEQVRVGRKRER